MMRAPWVIHRDIRGRRLVTCRHCGVPVGHIARGNEGHVDYWSVFQASPESAEDADEGRVVFCVEDCISATHAASSLFGQTFCHSSTAFGIKSWWSRNRSAQTHACFEIPDYMHRGFWYEPRDSAVIPGFMRLPHSPRDGACSQRSMESGA